MSEKKQIDKLFKEQLKDFEVAPGDHVWDRIEGELHKDKRRRRVIPIWWRVVGAVAILTLLFTVGKSFFETSEANKVETEIVDKEPKSNNSSNDANNMLEDSLFEPENDSKVADAPDQNDDNSSDSQKLNTQSKVHESQLVIGQKTESQKEHKNVTPQNNDPNYKSAIATSKSDHNKNKSEFSPSENTQNTTLAENDTKRVQSKEDPLKSVEEMNAAIKKATDLSETKVSDASSSEKEHSEIAVDSTNTTKERNAIEEAIAQAENTEKENDDKDDAPSQRWSVAPNVAPVYFNTLGEGSPIDDQFISNTKEGDINVSYGIRGSYAINDKLKIRAGVNRVDLGYSTRNVIEFSRPNASISSSPQLKNVKLHDNSSTFISANNISLSTAPDILFIKEQGSIDQQLGFIEVPLELEYSLVNKKFGLNLIGGFSTLFLNNNEIYSVQNNGVRTLLGEATNINNLSYSANFGVGFNYSLSQKLRFNLEPMFKYQINTFNDTSGDFQPFFIGVYTGLSFKF